jgi:hypothetical protein
MTHKTLIANLSVALLLFCAPQISSAAQSADGTAKAPEIVLPQLMHLNSPGAMRLPAQDQCGSTVAKFRYEVSAQDVLPTIVFLSERRSQHLSAILENYGEIFTWWLRVQRSAGYISIVTAVHEATHFAHALLTVCSNGKKTYALRGQIFETKLLQGVTRHASFAASFVPNETSARGFRFRKYLVESTSNAANQFPTLLDELIAHLGAAEAEIAIAMHAPELVSDSTGIQSFDGNLPGASEFLLFCISYLEGLRSVNEYELRLLLDTDGVKPLLNAAWLMYTETLERYRLLDADVARKIPLNVGAHTLLTSDRFAAIRDIAFNLPLGKK